MSSLLSQVARDTAAATPEPPVAMPPAPTPAPVVPVLDDVPQQPKKPLAVLIACPGEHLSDPVVMPWAEKFYGDVLTLLEEMGYETQVDQGLPYTSPPDEAVLWVGHDLGVKRFHRAHRSVKLVALETEAAYEEFPGKTREEKMRMQRYNQAHYTLSERDKKNLMAVRVQEKKE